MGSCAGFGVPFPRGSACGLLLGSLGMSPPRLQFLLLVAYPGPPGFLRGQDSSQRPGPPKALVCQGRCPLRSHGETCRGTYFWALAVGWALPVSPDRPGCLQLGEQEGLRCPPRGRGPEAERGPPGGRVAAGCTDEASPNRGSGGRWGESCQPRPNLPFAAFRLERSRPPPSTLRCGARPVRCPPRSCWAACARAGCPSQAGASSSTAPGAPPGGGRAASPGASRGLGDVHRRASR